jgi:hypothetical protein
MDQNLLPQYFNNFFLYWVKMTLPYPIPSTVLWKSREGQSHLKKHTKLTQELQLDWVKLLPLSLFCTWAIPLKLLLIYPIGAMYGHPLVTPGLPTTPSNIPPPLLSSFLCFMRTTLWTHLDTQLWKPTSLSPANPYPVQSENGFIIRDKYPLFPYNLLGRAPYVLF